MWCTYLLQRPALVERLFRQIDQLKGHRCIHRARRVVQIHEGPRRVGVQPLGGEISRSAPAEQQVSKACVHVVIDVQGGGAVRRQVQTGEGELDLGARGGVGGVYVPGLLCLPLLS